jgi:hypothetical protein
LRLDIRCTDAASNRAEVSYTIGATVKAFGLFAVADVVVDSKTASLYRFLGMSRISATGAMEG